MLYKFEVCLNWDDKKRKCIGESYGYDYDYHPIPQIFQARMPFISKDLVFAVLNWARNENGAEDYKYIQLFGTKAKTSFDISWKILIDYVKNGAEDYNLFAIDGLAYVLSYNSKLTRLKYLDMFLITFVKGVLKGKIYQAGIIRAYFLAMKYLAAQLSERKIPVNECCTPIIKDILGGFFDGISTSNSEVAKKLNNLFKYGYLKHVKGFYEKTLDGYILDHESVSLLWALLDYMLDMSIKEDKDFYNEVYNKILSNQKNFTNDKGMYVHISNTKMTQVILVEAPELPSFDARYVAPDGNLYGIIMPDTPTIISDYLTSDKCLSTKDKYGCKTCFGSDKLNIATRKCTTTYSFCRSFDKNICQCFAEWDPPTKPVDICNKPTKNVAHRNCIEPDKKSPEVCGLCKIGFKANSEGICEAGNCPVGCKFCHIKSYAYCKSWTDLGKGPLCNCFAEWTSNGSDVCYVKSPNTKSRNCVEIQSGGTNCVLCKPYYILNTASGECEKRPKIKTECPEGCKYCQFKLCLICDLGYIKQGATRNCLLSTIDATNYIANCKHHKTDSGCYECDDGYVLDHTSTTCEAPSVYFAEKLRKCRIFADVNKNSCGECLPEYNQIDPIGNTECSEGLKCQVCDIGFWKSETSDSCNDDMEDTKNKLPLCDNHYIKGGCYQCEQSLTKINV